MKDKFLFVTVFLVIFFICILSVFSSYSGHYTINQFTDNSCHYHHLYINNNGEVVWQGSDGSDFEVFLYNGLNRTQISNNSYDNVIKLRFKFHFVQSYAFCRLVIEILSFRPT